MFRTLKRKENTGLGLVLMWVTALMLSYFAILQPLNRILFLIRQTGVISVSPSSIIENKHIIMPVLFGEFAKWVIVVVVWFALVIALNTFNKKDKAIFEKVTDIICKESLLDKLFYIGAFIEMIWGAFYYASFNIPCASFWIFVALMCFSTKILAEKYMCKYTDRQWLGIVLLIIMGIVCELFTGRALVLRAILLIIASGGIDWKWLLKWYVIINSVAFVVITLAAFWGISGSMVEIDAFRTMTEVTDRYLLGYNSPNTTSYIVLKICLVAMYVWWDKIKWWHILTLTGANIVMYLLTDSRTSFMVALAATLLTIFYKYFSKIRDMKIWTVLTAIMIVILAGFSVHLLQWDFNEYDNLHSCPRYIYLVNDKIFGRIHQAIKFTHDIVPLPFGTYKPGAFCDMGYVKFFLQEGFIPFIVYFIAVFKALYWQNKNKEYPFIIIIVIISIRMFMESSFVPFVFQNVILMLFIGRWDKILCKME